MSLFYICKFLMYTCVHSCCTCVFWEADIQWRFHNLFSKKVLLIKEKDDGRVNKELIVTYRVKEQQRLMHTVLQRRERKNVIKHICIFLDCIITMSLNSASFLNIFLIILHYIIVTESTTSTATEPYTPPTVTEF